MARNGYSLLLKRLDNTKSFITYVFHNLDLLIKSQKHNVFTVRGTVIKNYWQVSKVLTKGI